MDILVIILIAAVIGLSAVRFLSKNSKLRETADRILYVIAALLVLYISLTQYLGSSGQPEVIDPDPTPSVIITDPGTDEPSGPVTEPENDPVGHGTVSSVIDENGAYDSKEDVALYIHIYGKLPPNYITKNEAEKLGLAGRLPGGHCAGQMHWRIQVLQQREKTSGEKRKKVLRMRYRYHRSFFTRSQEDNLLK